LEYNIIAQNKLENPPTFIMYEKVGEILSMSALKRSKDGRNLKLSFIFSQRTCRLKITSCLFSEKVNAQIQHLFQANAFKSLIGARKKSRNK